MVVIKRKVGLIIFFCCLLGISHVLLPYLDKVNAGPFFRWNLFSSIDDSSYADLELLVNGQAYFLTGSIPNYDHNEKRIKLWSFTSELAGELERPELAKSRLEKIKALLTEDHIQLVSVCKIKRPLAAYLLLSPTEKREACATLSF